MTENNKLPPEMTVDEALQYADDRTIGATFYEGKRDLQMALALLAYEVRRLRQQVNEGFINDEYAKEKNERIREFSERVKSGLAKATDASMFHGLARESKVKYKDENFDD